MTVPTPMIIVDSFRHSSRLSFDSIIPDVPGASEEGRPTYFNPEYKVKYNDIFSVELNESIDSADVEGKMNKYKVNSSRASSYRKSKSSKSSSSSSSSSSSNSRSGSSSSNSEDSRKKRKKKDKKEKRKKKYKS